MIKYRYTCGHCGQEFESASDKARYCSNKCRQAEYRFRKQTGQRVKIHPKSRKGETVRP